MTTKFFSTSYIYQGLAESYNQGRAVVLTTAIFLILITKYLHLKMLNISQNALAYPATGFPDKNVILHINVQKVFVRNSIFSCFHKRQLSLWRTFLLKKTHMTIYVYVVLIS